MWSVVRHIEKAAAERKRANPPQSYPDVPNWQNCWRANYAGDRTSTQHTGDTTSTQHTGDTTSTQHTGDTTSTQHTGDTTSTQHTGNTTSTQHTGNTTSTQHTGDTTSTQHTGDTTSTQHTGDTTSTQHTGGRTTVQCCSALVTPKGHVLHILWTFTPGTTNEEHNVNLKEILHRVREVGLKMNFSKCKFRTASVTFVGHKFTEEGLQPDPEKTDAVGKMPPPEDRAALLRMNYLS